VRQNGIHVGAVMMRSGTTFPESVRVEETPYSTGWEMINNAVGHDLDRMIRKADWNFFFMAGSIQANALGRQSETTTRSALKRILAKVKSSTFNCLEITELSTRTLFGIPYTHVAAHSRHLQSGCYLKQAAERSQIQADAAWAVKWS
jgi:hypothetical protein